MKNEVVIIIRNAYRHDFGGGERFPVFLAQALASNNLNPTVVSRHSRMLEFAQNNDISTIRSLWWGKQNWSGYRALLLPVYIVWQVILFGWYLGIFVNRRPAVVHIQSKDDFIAATLAGRCVGARIVWTDHADLKHVWNRASSPLRNPTGKLVLWAARYAHVVTVVSQSELALVSEQLHESSPIADKLTVVHNGSSDKLSEYTNEEPATDSAFTYVIASRLVVDKGIGEAIEAFTAVHSQYPETRLLVIGDGPGRDRFKEMAKDNDAIDFTGHLHDPLGAIRSADVFLQPTYHEGFSVGLVEACMLAMPIIATHVGGNPEIIKDGHNGILIPPKDSRALADAMLELYDDKMLRESLATNARRTYLDGFVFEDIVQKQFIPLYKGDFDAHTS